MGSIATFQCVACGGKELCFGYLGSAATTFVPSGMFTIHGYRFRSYVCLNCGSIGQYIPKDKLDNLREKFKERDSSSEG